MLRSKLSYALCAGAIISLSLVMQAWAEEGGGGVIITIPGGAAGAGGATTKPGDVVVIPEGGGGQRGGWGDPEQMKKRFEEMRKQMSAQMQKDMGATDDEWKVLEPKIQKLTELGMKSRTGGMGFRFRMGDGAGADAEKPNPVEAARKDLQKVLDNKDAKPEEVKKALTAYRDARDKAKQEAKAELEKVQKDLRDILTQRQEAYLVTRGLLD